MKACALPVFPDDVNLVLEPYADHVAHAPRAGRHILAQHDADTVVVYQAYRPSIVRWALAHGRLGGPEFSLARMSWVKPNFLWMMYRSGWGTKEGQEVVLAVRLRRSAFDEILAGAVSSSYVPEVYASAEQWRHAVKRSEVRLQWDPDHDPRGSKLERRAIQLGLAGDVLRSYAHDWIVGIEDISGFVAEQRAHAESEGWANLATPREEVYPVSDSTTAQHLGVNCN